MRWFVYGHDKLVAKWVADRMPYVSEFNQCAAIGLAENKQLIAAVVYHNYIPDYGNIEISMAADTPRWATPEAIGTFLRYPFVQLRCRRVTTCTPAKNKRALRFNYGIGFKKEGVVRQGYGKDDLVVCGLLYREAKKWIETTS